MLMLKMQEGIPAIMNFVRNRLVLSMAAQDIKVLQRGIVKTILRVRGYLDKSESIDETIFVLEDKPERVSFIVDASVKKGDYLQSCPAVVALREAGSGATELYFEAQDRSFGKGLYPADFEKSGPLKGQVVKVIMWIVVAVLVIASFAIPPSLLLWPVIMVIALISTHLKQRKKLRYQLLVLNTLSEIFEGEFGATEKKGTKESVGFWGQIISDVELTDLIP